MCTVYRVFAALSLLMVGVVAFAGDPFGADWPEGPNRELTGAFCGSCHSLSLVKQQRQSRAGWDKLMLWMTKTQNMPDLQSPVRDQILDYLETNFGIEDSLESDDLLEADSGLQGVALPPLVDAE